MNVAHEPVTVVDGVRVESDLLGPVAVPNDAYYGVHTVRALANFQISATPVSTYSDFVVALAEVKQAAAIVNRELGLLEESTAEAIVWACEQLRSGRHHDQFVVDSVQGGAGTSTNMNANEVLANVALERMGYPKGAYDVVHPVEHVNLGQSTNDVHPTALRIALYRGIQGLEGGLAELQGAFRTKAAEFSGVLKLGRTQLQDAVPMTLGQEFGAYAVTIGEDRDRLDETRRLLTEVSIGGTAIGTALNAHPEFRTRVLHVLRELSGITTLSGAANLIQATQDMGAYVQVSGVLKRTAVKLSKICNDLRLLSSGPQAGLAEINLPPRQAGSSIMPGKVNPVIPEVVNQIAYEVVGHDLTVTMAAESGQLQLNAFAPVIARSLFTAISHLTAGVAALGDHCVAGITANADYLARTVAGSAGLATALNPAIGYVAATSIAREALRERRTVSDVALERGLLPPVSLARLLSVENLTGQP